LVCLGQCVKDDHGGTSLLRVAGAFPGEIHSPDGGPQEPYVREADGTSELDAQRLRDGDWSGPRRG
jgi:hypothetical protein